MTHRDHAADSILKAVLVTMRFDEQSFGLTAGATEHEPTHEALPSKHAALLTVLTKIRLYNIVL